MGDSIIPLEGEFAPEEARGWDGKIFRQVCGEAQRERSGRGSTPRDSAGLPSTGWTL